MNIHTQTNSRYFDLSGLGLLQISGLGAAKLMQGQFSCEIDGITSTHSVMGAHCNPQGRIISLFYVTRIDDDYYLIMPKALLAIAENALKKYAPFFKATLKDATDAWHLLGASGDEPANNVSATISLPNSHRQIRLLAAAPTQDLQDFESWQHLDIQEGIPSLYPETSGTFLPHDLNLPALNAINFAKGCFTGQEIIARMHYRGKPKNHLYYGLADDALMPGTILYHQEQPAGTVINGCQRMHDNQYALLLMTNETTAQTKQLQTSQGSVIKLQQSE